MNKFRELRADEIECRVGTCNERGFTILLYKNARCDQSILDETVGADNWQRDHKEVKGNLFCGVSIWDESKKQWITKWDCGVESNTEKEKGEASDSFKRACFNWGIGRELYTSPFIYIKGHTEKNNKNKDVPTYRTLSVESIAYSDGKISKLSILGDGDRIYTFNGDLPIDAAKSPNTERKPQVEQSRGNGVEMTLEQAYAMKTAKGTPYNKLTNDNLEYIIAHTSNARYIKAAQLVLADRKNNEELQELEAPIIEEGLPF